MTNLALEPKDMKNLITRDITRDDVCYAKRPSLWDFGNGRLYSLCQDYPSALLLIN